MYNFVIKLPYIIIIKRYFLKNKMLFKNIKYNNYEFDLYLCFSSRELH